MLKSIFLQIARESQLEDNLVEKILLHITRLSREDLFLTNEIHPSHLYSFQKCIHDIKNGIPEAYIFGEQEFFGRSFYSNISTLIPRPETELLVSVMRGICLKYANINQSTYIDIGTGTGCILVSLLIELQPLRFCSVYGVDIEDTILELTQKNIDRYNLSVNGLIKSSLLDIFLEKKYELHKNLFISANLPYIRSGDTSNMGESVVKYEPSSALYGGDETGFELYEKLIHQCFVLKKIYDIESIHLCIEIGYDQYEHSRAFLAELGLRFEFFQDMHNIQRIVYIVF